MESVKRLLADWVEQGLIPGAALRVVNRDGLLFACDAGRTSLPDGQPVTPDTLFDLASLTKVTATLPAVLLLMQEGRLALDDSAGRFFPDCPADKRSITIEQLLTHTAGLAADAAERRRDGHIRLPELLYGRPLLHPPGERVVYSDLGMIWLGLLVEKLTGEPLDRYVKRRVFDPLGMRHTCFRPDRHIFRNIASTEFCRLTNRFLTGEVHDEKAYAMGGVAGHAGLFATADDLCRYAEMWLGGEPSPIAPEWRERAVRCRTEGRGGARGLGWEMNSAGEGLSCGGGFSRNSFGHTGFTGTSMWIDPERGWAVIFLTNAVHLGRDHALRRLRPVLHDAVTARLLPDLT